MPEKYESEKLLLNVVWQSRPHAYADVCQKSEVALECRKALVPCTACFKLQLVIFEAVTERQGSSYLRDSTVMRYAWSLPSTPVGRILRTLGSVMH